MKIDFASMFLVGGVILLGLCGFAPLSRSSCTSIANPGSDITKVPAPRPIMSTSMSNTEADDSWRQSAREPVHSAEIATQKAYAQVERRVENVTLTGRILAVLHENKSTRNSDISVATNNGIVTLTGRVGSGQEAKQVEQVVLGVYGVKSVNNSLSYSGGPTGAIPGDADSTGVAHPAYSDTAPAENAPVR
jgi:hyperosmotically inducible protein